MERLTLDEPVRLEIVVKTINGRLYLKRQEQGKRYPVCETKVFYKERLLGKLPGYTSNRQAYIRLNGVRWKVASLDVKYEPVEPGTEVKPDETSEGRIQLD